MCADSQEPHDRGPEQVEQIRSAGETLEPAPESLKKLQIDGPALLDLITQMGDNFGIAVGRLENVLAEAKRVGRNWLWRRNLMARAFT